MATGCFLVVFACLLGKIICQQTFPCVECTDCAKLTCTQANNTVSCNTSCFSQELPDGKINRGCYSNSTCDTTLPDLMATTVMTTTVGGGTALGNGSSITGNSSSTGASNNISSASNVRTPVPVILCCKSSTCGRAAPLSRSVASVVPDIRCSAASLLPGVLLLTVAALLAAAGDLFANGVRSRNVPLM